MSYIGKQPVVGNFQKCDAISVVNGQAAYSLTVGSAAVNPENANHMLVSLNGVLQAPGDSFTVSGSTLTFASNLATGDVIDFVIILGDVLDLGAPSDNTVATASIQANAVTAAKLNNDIISGTTALAEEPADTDEFLLSDGGTLKRIDYSYIKGGGITVADQWRLNTNATPSNTSLQYITANLERIDTTGQGTLGSAMTESSGIFTFPSTGIWLVRASLQFSNGNDNSRFCQNHIQVTTDNSSYTSVTEATGFLAQTGGTAYAQVPAQTLIDVTDVSQVKVRFAYQVASTGSSMVLYASSTTNRNYFTFIRLGDT